MPSIEEIIQEARSKLQAQQDNNNDGDDSPISDINIGSEDRDDRLSESGDLLGDVAVGEGPVPGSDQEAVAADMEGTISGQEDIEQIDSVTADTGPEVTPEDIDTTTGDASQAEVPEEIEASTVDDVSTVEDQESIDAATGEVSDESLIDTDVDLTPSEGAQAEAATVEEEDIPDGAEVEAAAGQVSEEALAEAAQVAGLETSRINQAKKQLRNAGLSEEEISEFSNNPEALEERLTDFTEEQRGMVEGLPEEALVSYQMESLTEGMESGEIPDWAKPAVSNVEKTLAARGMSASTVGQTALTNTIMQAALPIAQQNAQSIQQSSLQRRELQQRGQIAEAEFEQQTAMQNAQNVFNMDSQNLDNEQQSRLANSQFLQSVTLENANNEQQTAMQNAATIAEMDLTQADINSQHAIENARAFLQTDLQNLNNEQQSTMLEAQQQQQRLLSNQSAENAAKQFNAQSENQVNQFMTSLKSNIAQFNSKQKNAMEQFNVAESNKIEAQEAGNDLQAQQYNSQMLTQVEQFNAEMDAQARQWNAQNAQAIEQSNIQWRRKANTAETAAQNAINQQNVQNAMGLTSQAQAAMWQELRDQATFDFQGYENEENRKAQLYATAIGNESQAASSGYSQSENLVDIASSLFSDTGSESGGEGDGGSLFDSIMDTFSSDEGTDLSETVTQADVRPTSSEANVRGSDQSAEEVLSTAKTGEEALSAAESGSNLYETVGTTEEVLSASETGTSLYDTVSATESALSTSSTASTASTGSNLYSTVSATESALGTSTAAASSSAASGSGLYSTVGSTQAAISGSGTAAGTSSAAAGGSSAAGGGAAAGAATAAGAAAGFGILGMAANEIFSSSNLRDEQISLEEGGVMGDPSTGGWSQEQIDAWHEQGAFNMNPTSYLSSADMDRIRAVGGSRTTARSVLRQRANQIPDFTVEDVANVTD